MTRPASATSAVPRSAARGNHPAGRALSAPVVRRPDAARSVVTAGVSPLRVVRDGRAAPCRVADPAPVRLTRRGRAVLTGLVVAGGIGLAALAGPAVLGGGSAQPAIVLAGETSVVVRPGDTLWSIAVALAPESDPRAVVDALREANRLEGVELVPGQVLVVP